MAVAVPAATRAVIGGSGSLAAEFPGDLHAGARLLERDLVFETPWGDSPPFTLFEIGGHTALHVRMHGWRKGVSRGRASRQVFSVLHRAGVKRILSDAGVGSLNHLLDPGDLVVVDDFVDQTTDRDRYGVVVGDHLLIMRDPVCAAGREALVSAARRLAPARRVFTRGTYVVTEGPRFESPAEVRHLQTLGDVVGPELLPRGLAGPRHRRLLRGHLPHRQLRRGRRAGVGARRAGAASSTTTPASWAASSSSALAALPDDDDCHCRELRKPTLLG